MVPIKLTVAFVLAAAAIAPVVVAQPIYEPTTPTPSTREYVDDSELEARSHDFGGHHEEHQTKAVDRDSNDMFERYSEDVESGANALPHFNSPMLGHGPVVRRPFTSQRSPFRVGLRRPFRSNPGSLPFHPYRRPSPFGPGRMILPHRSSTYPRRVHFINRHAPRIGASLYGREYAENDDMFERNFEDVEFDARDFDNELYLD